MQKCRGLVSEQTFPHHRIGSDSISRGCEQVYGIFTSRGGAKRHIEHLQVAGEKITDRKIKLIFAGISDQSFWQHLRQVCVINGCTTRVAERQLNWNLVTNDGNQLVLQPTNQTAVCTTLVMDVKGPITKSSVVSFR